ncbi:MAG: DUF4919 domain-containing protein [Myxococcales bacterium]|nr:DUF4919 domain-containing protein [Myxococcales bacterium]
MHPSFEQMLEQAKQDPASVNFSDLRQAYTETPAYSPHSPNDALHQQLAQAMEQQDWSLALQLSNQLLEQNYLDIKAHLWAKSIYEQLQQNDHAWFHYRFASGLLDSIRDSGDGQSPQTAYVLIDPSEKWAFLESQGYQYVTEQRHPDAQHVIEIVDVRDPHQQSARLYFNLDSTEEKTSVALGGPRNISDFGLHGDDAAFAAPADDMAFAAPADEMAFAAPSEDASFSAHAVEEPEEAAPKARRRRRRRQDEDEEEQPRTPDKSIDLHEIFDRLKVKLGENNAIYTQVSNLSADAQKEMVGLHKAKDRLKIQKGAGWFLSGLGFLGGLGLFAIWLGMLTDGTFRNDFVFMTILFATFGAMCLVWGGTRLWGIFRSTVGSFFYPNAFYLLRTDFECVEAWPYVFLNPDGCRLTHHTTDGNYNYSDLQLNFLGYGNVGITLHDMHLAEEFLGVVFERRADAFSDLAESDFTYAEGAELMQTEHGTVAPKQSKWKRPLIWAAITGICLVAGYPVNNYFVEEKDWDFAISSNRRYSYEDYLRRYPNGRYAKDARLGIDNVSFEEARKQYTAVAFRRYLNEFPQGQHVKNAKEMLGDLYEKSIKRYKEQIGTPNRATGLILKILEDLKKHDNHTVFVRFTPRLLFEEKGDAESKRILDLALKFSVQPSYIPALKRQNSYIPAPIKPAFKPEENILREQFIVKQLEDAFRAIVPQGVMGFMRVDEPPPGARVVFNIKYDIRQKFLLRPYFEKLQRTLRYSRTASGRELNALVSQILNDNSVQKVPVIYVQTRSRSYGYRYKYRNSTTKTPVRTLFGVEMDWSMDIKLADSPPEKFAFASDAATSIRLGGRTSDPIDVYRQIAQSAFKRFSEVLQKHFGVHGITAPSYKRYGSNRYRNRYRRYGSSYRPPAYRAPTYRAPAYRAPSYPRTSPLSKGVGTPTGSANIDRFVRSMPYAMRKEYMDKSHFHRRMAVIRLWTKLDRMYYKLPYRIRRRYRRYSMHARRVRMLRMLDRNKNRQAPIRRRRSNNDDPFAP